MNLVYDTHCPMPNCRRIRDALAKYAIAIAKGSQYTNTHAAQGAHYVSILLMLIYIFTNVLVRSSVD